MGVASERARARARRTAEKAENDGDGVFGGVLSDFTPEYPKPPPLERQRTERTALVLGAAFVPRHVCLNKSLLTIHLAVT